MWRKKILKTSTLLVEMYIGSATVVNSMDIPQKIKNRSALWFSNSTAGCISRKHENASSIRNVHPNVQQHYLQ